MPIYEYKCNQCETTFELIQKASDEPASNCTNCGKEGVEKLVSQSSFKLKGTGWYKTDYPASGTANTESKKKKNKADKKPAGGCGSGCACH